MVSPERWTCLGAFSQVSAERRGAEADAGGFLEKDTGPRCCPLDGRVSSKQQQGSVGDVLPRAAALNQLCQGGEWAPPEGNGHSLRELPPSLEPWPQSVSTPLTAGRSLNAALFGRGGGRIMQALAPWHPLVPPPPPPPLPLYSFPRPPLHL